MVKSISKTAPKKPQIILLEDEPLLVKLFEFCIAEWFKKTELLEFKNGDDAWQELSRMEPDLLIMDGTHPGLGGLEIMDRLFKRCDLRLALVSLGRFEQEVVVALGVERRVEVDEINGFGGDVLAQHIEVVAEVELVHPRLDLTVSNYPCERNFARNANAIPKIVPNYHSQTLTP